MKKLFVVFFTLSCTLMTSAQTSPEKLIIDFFKEYPKNPGKSLESLYATNTWASRNQDAIEQLKGEVNKLTVDYVGKYYGYELITKKQFSESFIVYSYMIKYDRQPLRFLFKFYKANETWSLFSFSMDANLDVEIEEATKLYHLNLDEK